MGILAVVAIGLLWAASVPLLLTARVVRAISAVTTLFLRAYVTG